MSNITLDKLCPIAAQRIKPFLEEILNKYQEKIHSIYITGTAITEDFNPDSSDINSIFVLKEMDLKFLELIAPLGKKYGKNRVSAPLIMTPEYIKKSLDVFPIEFLSFKLIHAVVFGDDILKDIELNKKDLRHQCEREVKVKLIGLRQLYISASGNRKILREGIVNSITGYIPLFRAMIFLYDKPPAVKQREVITAIPEVTGINTAVFIKLLNEKYKESKLSIEELNTIFGDYYTTTERLEQIIDEIKA